MSAKTTWKVSHDKIKHSLLIESSCEQGLVDRDSEREQTKRSGACDLMSERFPARDQGRKVSPTTDPGLDASHHYCGHCDFVTATINYGAVLLLYAWISPALNWGLLSLSPALSLPVVSSLSFFFSFFLFFLSYPSLFSSFVFGLSPSRCLFSATERTVWTCVHPFSSVRGDLLLIYPYPLFLLHSP